MRLAFFSALAAGLVALAGPTWAESPSPAGSAPGAAAAGQPLASAETPVFRLIMVEREGCIYCARWNETIGPIYPKTPEGQIAPLERVDIHDDWAKGLETGPAPVFTPTFVLIEGDREVGRIEGYPGEDFFWSLLGEALRGAGAPLPPA